MNKTLIIVLLTVIFIDPILMKTNSMSGEPPPRYVIDQYYRAGTRTIDTLIRKIERVLPEGQRRMLNKIDIGISRNDWNLYGVYARKTGKYREIRFSMGFIIASDFIDTAIVAGELGGFNEDIVMQYITEVTNTIIENVHRGKRGEPRQSEPIFHEWVGWPDSKWEALINTEEFKAYKDVIKLESMAFILGHELSHHFFGHLDNHSSSIDDEDEADREGVRMAIGAGYNPLLAFQNFILFAALEGDQLVDESTRTHSPPLCRGKYLFDVGVQYALRDSEFIDYMKQRGMYYEWKENIEKMDEAYDEFLPECL